MYVRNEILVFTPGRGQEGLDRLNWIHCLMVPQPGFRDAMVAKYLGDGSRHTIMRFWENEDLYNDFRAKPEGSYGNSKPEGIYLTERVINPLVSHGDLEGTVKGSFLVKVQFEIAEGASESYIAYQQMWLALAKGIPGLAWTRQMATKDQLSGLTVTRLRSREDFERLLETPEYCDFSTKLPAGVSVAHTSCFDVVSDTLGARPAVAK